MNQILFIHSLINDFTDRVAALQYHKIDHEWVLKFNHNLFVHDSKPIRNFQKKKNISREALKAI